MAKASHQARVIDGVTHLVPKKTPRRHLRQWARHASQRNVLPIIVILAVVGGVFLLHTVRQPSTNVNTKSGLMTRLAKHVVLPNEQPLIATVTDQSALKTPFLKEAQNGDKVIIFEKAKRVIIYRPSIDRIVDIGPVELGNIPKVSQ